MSSVAIVDYGLGNLYSVKQACAHVGLDAVITSAKRDLLEADAVILPGVGAFGDAMATLRRLDLVSVLQDIATTNKPLVGICLGIQLLMTESFEFGQHKGLGIIEGTVVRLSELVESERALKIPHVGWNRIHHLPKSWQDTLLEGLCDGAYMYFVHSFIVWPQNEDVIISKTRYGDTEFCSSLQYKNVFACQFHPERSALTGIRIYQNLATQIRIKGLSS